MNAEPTFGIPSDDVEYRRRHGVYAVIVNEAGRFASVAAKKGLFLPGGGIEAGESPEETLAREVREECARDVVIGRFLGSAIQYHSETDGSRHWEFHCSYFAAEFGASLENDPEHELIWLEFGESHRLSFDVHRWGVNQLMLRN